MPKKKKYVYSYVIYSLGNKLLKSGYVVASSIHEANEKAKRHYENTTSVHERAAVPSMVDMWSTPPALKQKFKVCVSAASEKTSWDSVEGELSEIDEKVQKLLEEKEEIKKFLETKDIM